MVLSVNRFTLFISKTYQIFLLVILVIFSSLAVLFFKFSLESHSLQLAENIHLQNISAMESGDTLKLTTNLNHLKINESIKCITGTFKAKVFFKYEGFGCEDRFSLHPVSIRSEGNPDVQIDLVIGLPAVQMRYFYLFLLLIFTLVNFAIAVIIALKNKEAVELKKRYYFAQQISHDIRAPLQAISIATDRLSSQLPEVHLIKNASHRLSSIANSLLEYSKSSRGEELRASRPSGIDDFSIIQLMKKIGFIGRSSFTANVVANNPDGQALQLNKIIRDQILEKRLVYPDIFIEATDLQDFETHMDGTTFSRIISNIIQNSIEAKTEERVLKISISTRAYKKSGVICIQDNGKGIPEDQLKQIGDYGFSSGKSNGHGLGLANAKEILGNFGGTLAIQSKQGEGTIVTLTLPRQ